MTGNPKVTWESPVGSVGRIRFAGPPFINWAFVVSTDQGSILIDTGNPGLEGELVDLLREKEIRPSRVLLSHHHPTHSANAPAVADAFGCEIWAHADNAPLCRNEGVQVDRTFAAGDVIAGAVEVVDAPGHAPGNVAFYVRPGRVMLSGDVVMGLGSSADQPLCLPGAHAGAPSGQLEADVKHLLSYPFDVLLPAHGHHVESEAQSLVARLVESA